MRDPLLRQRTTLILSTGLALALAHAAAAKPRTATPTAATPGPTVPLVATQMALGSAAERTGATGGGTLRADYGDGGRLVRIEQGQLVKVLTPGFASAADPDVSFDGQRILFAGKRRPDERWAIYEMNANGSGVRQVFAAPDDLRQPVYLPTVYTIVADPTRGTEPRDHIGLVRIFRDQRNEYGDAPTSALYSVKLDGSQPRRLTFSLSNHMDPTVLRDGRVVYAAWQRATLERGSAGRIALVGVNPDGLDPAIFAADEGQRVKMMPCATPTPDRLVVFVEADQVGWDGAGALASVSLRRNLHSHRRLTESANGLFHSPAALPNGTIVASRRPANGSGTHGLVWVDPRTGRIVPLFDDPRFHEIQAHPIAARPRPDSRSSAVKDPDEKGTTATTAPSTDVAVPDGKLYGLNVYLNDFGLDLPEGTIAALRILEGLPSHGGSDQPVTSARRLVGETPVERDGSFQAQVPAETPLQLQLLDRDGLALRTSGWVWVPYKGQQGCVGCHEDGELTPSNRFIDAITRSATSLLAPAAQRRTVDFKRDIHPIVAARCAGCHGTGPAPRLDGDSLAAYAALMGRFVHPGQARTSPLVWHLFGRNTARPWDGAAAQRAARPLPQDAGLAETERRLIVEWIDLGAPYDGGNAHLPATAPTHSETSGGAR